MASYYPVFLNLKSRSCVVIGGGEVAERKIRSLLESGCRVSMVSIDPTPTLQGWANEGAIAWTRREYRPGDLKDAFLAIAATDQTTINQAIAKEAEKEGVLLNVVDNTPLCTFIAPSVIKRGEVTVAISTGGASPALARKLREGLEESQLMDYAELAPLLSRARQEVKVRGLEVHPDRWQQCINPQLVTMVRNGHEAEALKMLLVSLSR